MSRVTRKAQMEWAAAKDEWLAANQGKGFADWRAERRAQKRAKRDAAWARFSENTAAAIERRARGETTISDIPYLTMDDFRRQFEHQILYGNGARKC
jgi:hypothetical protein